MTLSSTPSTLFNPSVKFPKAMASAEAAPAVPPEVALCEALPHNQALIRFVMQHPQGISAAALFDDYDDAGDSFESFARRLTYLRSKRWLLKDGEGRGALYRFNTERSTRPAPAPVKACPASAASELARLAAPARRNVMAGTYQSAPTAARHPGSDDYLAIPSLHQGRRVPFVPGYIFY